MNRKPRFFIAAISAAITILILAFSVRRPHYMHYYHDQCHQREMQQEQ